MSPALKRECVINEPDCGARQTQCEAAAYKLVPGNVKMTNIFVEKTTFSTESLLIRVHRHGCTCDVKIILNATD